ncbi:MAG TPA: DEAD/DEAH box helicase [Myxococcales bacterium]|nr:DEAD/DEAH box helicase [Myxococcales bacterium]
MPSFAELGAPEPLATALAARGYETPTPVQAVVLEADAQGRDLLVSARTGSGKTVAFGLAVGAELLPLPKPGKPLCLVVAPTRELAHQVARELAWLYSGCSGLRPPPGAGETPAPPGARIATCVGGADVGAELRALKSGAHVVVGTPGRLVDHLERGSLHLDGLRALVLDEADEMLDLGFREELEKILGAAPAERRTLLFSATIPPEIERLARKYSKDALRIAANPPAQAHADIEVRAHVVAPREREHAVVNVLRYHDAPAAIVFCATREGVTHLAQALIERGFAAVPISGELTQSERTRALHALRDGRARVLVATDVAARGLDLPDVALVVQADPPQNAEVLQHRSGRTGRAGRKGVSVLLAPPPARKPVETMLRRAGLHVSFTPPPDADVIRVHDRDRLVREIDQLAREPFHEDDVALARLLLRDRDAEKLAAALVRLRREALPAPEELPFTAELAKRKQGDRQDVAGSKQKGRERDGGIWFRVNVGRSRNADPRWLLPILCRRGGVDRRMIGRIEVLADETRFEVSRPAAPHFRRAAGKPDRKDPNLRITQVE